MDKPFAVITTRCVKRPAGLPDKHMLIKATTHDTPQDAHNIAALLAKELTDTTQCVFVMRVVESYHLEGTLKHLSETQL